MSRYGSKKSYVFPGLACVLALAIVILGCGGGGAAVAGTNTTGSTGSSTTTGTTSTTGTTGSTATTGTTSTTTATGTGTTTGTTAGTTTSTTTSSTTGTSTGTTTGTTDGTTTGSTSTTTTGTTGTTTGTSGSTSGTTTGTSTGTTGTTTGTSGTTTGSTTGNGGLASSPWPKIHGDIRNSNSGQHSGSNGTVSWTFQINGHGEASPAIAPDGTLYFGELTGSKTYAVDRNGNLKWTFPVTCGYSSPAIGSDGTIYFGAQDTYFYALNPDGTLKWKFKTPFSLKSSPTIGPDGTIYFTTDSAQVFALNPNGTEKWIFGRVFVTFSGTPAIGPDGTIYVGGSSSNPQNPNGGLFALSPDLPGMMEKWRYVGNDWPQKYFTPSVSTDGTIYVGTGMGLTAVSSGGSKLWTVGKYVTECPAITPNGTIIAVGQGLNNSQLSSDFVWSFDQMGNLKWQVELPGATAPVVSSDGTSYVSSGGNMYAITSSGSVAWTIWAGGRCSPAALGLNGEMFFGSWAGKYFGIR